MIPDEGRHRHEISYQWLMESSGRFASFSTLVLSYRFALVLADAAFHSFSRLNRPRRMSNWFNPSTALDSIFPLHTCMRTPPHARSAVESSVMDIEMVATVGQSRQEAIEVTDHDHVSYCAAHTWKAGMVRRAGNRVAGCGLQSAIDPLFQLTLPFSVLMCTCTLCLSSRFLSSLFLSRKKLNGDEPTIAWTKFVER